MPALPISLQRQDDLVRDEPTREEADDSIVDGPARPARTSVTTKSPRSVPESSQAPKSSREARRDLNDVFCFARVVRHASFSRTADDFGISPSAVSRRISRLERAVGATLLHRSAHAVHLTAAGRAYFERISSALKMIEGNEDDEPALSPLEDGFVEWVRSISNLDVALDESERRLDLLTPDWIMTLTCRPEKTKTLGALARRLARPLLRLEPDSP